MSRKYIAAELGDLSGQSKKYVRVKADEKQKEFTNEIIVPDEGGVNNGQIWTNISNEELHFYLDGDKTIPHSGYHRCNLTKSADQSVDSSTWTSIAFDQETLDVGGLHDNSINNSRITIQKTGEYRIYYQVKCDGQDKTAYNSRVYKNGDMTIEGTCNIRTGSKDGSFLCLNLVSPIISLEAGDYIELQFYHDEGGSQDVLASNTFFGIQRIF